MSIRAMISSSVSTIHPSQRLRVRKVLRQRLSNLIRHWRIGFLKQNNQRCRKTGYTLLKDFDMDAEVFEFCSVVMHPAYAAE